MSNCQLVHGLAHMVNPDELVEAAKVLLSATGEKVERFPTAAVWGISVRNRA
jgi:hypothetical protein